MTHGDGSLRIEAIGTFLRLAAQLDQYGNADTLAEYLTEERMFGEPRSSCKCPIHTFFTKRMFGYYSLIHAISAGSGALILTFEPEQDGWIHDRLILDTPPTIRDFIKRFDDGAYPALVPGSVSLVKS